MQWQDPEILIFFVIRVFYEKLCRMLKPRVPKFHLDLSGRSKDIAEKQVPAKLKAIVVTCYCWVCFQFIESHASQLYVNR